MNLFLEVISTTRELRLLVAYKLKSRYCQEIHALSLIKDARYFCQWLDCVFLLEPSCVYRSVCCVNDKFPAVEDVLLFQGQRD